MLSACGGQVPEPGRERPANNESAVVEDMVAAIETITANRRQDGVVPRLNQAKGLGCLEGEFQVEDNLSPRLSQGLFASPGSYPAMARFAKASTYDDRDKDFYGMSIKVSGVDGRSLWGEDGTQDFLLNSHPALFAGNPGEFLDFLEASADEALWKFFINPLNWDSLWIILQGRETITSPFDIRYWSTTPYRLGSDQETAVKYSVRSCSAVQSDMPADPGPDYLRTAMGDHLAQGEACFDFMVQFQGDPGEMPIEDASVEWDEGDSPFQKVATLTFFEQDFISPEAMLRCEMTGFNPWQSLPAHRPLGGINRVRQEVYARAAEFRLRESDYSQVTE